MTFNPHVATEIEMRDWLAKREGWTRRGEWWRHPRWHRLGSGQKRHPIPATLDWVAKAMPGGWIWGKSAMGGKIDALGDRVVCQEYWAEKPGCDHEPIVPATDYEYTDRLRLLCLVLMTEDAEKGKEPTDGE